MRHAFSDTIKHRLVERSDIAEVVIYLQNRGMSTDAIPQEIARICYVDLDELNDLLQPPMAAE